MDVAVPVVPDTTPAVSSVQRLRGSSAPSAVTAITASTATPTRTPRAGTGKAVTTPVRRTVVARPRGCAGPAGGAGGLLPGRLRQRYRPPRLPGGGGLAGRDGKQHHAGDRPAPGGGVQEPDDQRARRGHEIARSLG